MTLRLDFLPGSPAPQQLLAVSLVLLRLLRTHDRLLLRIPRAVHETLDTQHYGALLYDNLASEHAPLDRRLSLRVHAAPFFEIETKPNEEAHVPA